MKRSEAEAFARTIIKKCEERHIWYDVHKSSRPKLGKIEIVISLKVDSDD